MFSYRSISILICFLSYCFCSNAQSNSQDSTVSFNNTIKLSTGDFRVAGVEHSQQNIPFSQIGVFYERRIYNGWGLGIGYSKWKSWKLFTESNGILLGPPGPPLEIGKLYDRMRYKMVDLYAFYKKTIRHKHVLGVSTGASYCWGENSYTSWFSINPEPPHDAQYFVREEKAMYWGAIASLGYDYIVHKRYSIGLNIRERIYSGRDKAQFDYSLHLGVQF